jgi:putative ABC transport system permease protein
MTAIAPLAPSKLLAIDILRVGTLGLRARRVRTALSCLGIAIGIAALVAVVGISASSQADLFAELDRLGTGVLTVTQGQSFGGAPGVFPNTAPGMIRRIAGVQHVAVTGTVTADVLRTDRVPPTETGGIQVLAVRPDLLRSLSGTIHGGAFLDAATTRYPAVVLGAAAAQSLGIRSVVPAQRVWLGGHWFSVRGILDPLPLAPELDSAALVGFPIAERVLGFDGSIGTIYVRSDPAAVPRVRDLLPPTVNPPDPSIVEVTRPSDVLAARTATNKAFTGLLLGLGAVALLVGGIGIANVMVIAVLERRSEIGLRRSFGATRRHIATQFVAEALFLSALGGATGVLLGDVATVAYAFTRHWSVSLPGLGSLGGFAAAVLTGVAAGSYPAIRAARLAPTEALRTV